MSILKTLSILIFLCQLTSCINQQSEKDRHIAMQELAKAREEIQFLTSQNKKLEYESMTKDQEIENLLSKYKNARNDREKLRLELDELKQKYE